MMEHNINKYAHCHENREGPFQWEMTLAINWECEILMFGLLEVFYRLSKPPSWLTHFMFPHFFQYFTLTFEFSCFLYQQKSVYYFLI